ncbi:flavin reductase family protein [Rhodococcus sp. NPDC060084]|uniref:flavin reductase family protein n=1 Tax=Rhodococcus sp. NPDC060084 TaxID=3347053 RepID=UPI00364AB3A2
MTGTRTVLDLENKTSAQRQGLLSQLVVPRPIAMISTLDANGSLNVAPYSYYMPVCGEPPTIAVTIGGRREADSGPKDTWANIERTGEFVVNVTGHLMADQIEVAAREYPTGTSEADVTGWTSVPSQLVAPPSLKESPAHLECRVLEVIDRGDMTTPFAGYHLVLAEVVCIVASDGVLSDTGRIDPTRVSPVGRMGFPQFVLADENTLFEQERIAYADLPEVRAAAER